MTDKIYLKNPYLKSIHSNVLNQEQKNNLFHIELDRTIFNTGYGSSQIPDRGFIENIEVLDVYEENSKVYHVLNKKLESNTVRIQIDWNFRFDMMQQHTGLHIIATVFSKLFDLEVKNTKIENDFSYISFNQLNLSSNDIQKIETLCNEMIFANSNVSNSPIDDFSLDELPLGKLPALSSESRLVQVDEGLMIPCLGTHVDKTGEVGILKIFESINKNDTSTLKFLCGFRVLNRFNELLKLNGYSLDCSLQNQINMDVIDFESIENHNIYKKTFDDKEFDELKKMARKCQRKKKSFVIFGNSNVEKSSACVYFPKYFKSNTKTVFSKLINSNNHKIHYGHDYLFADLEFSQLEIFMNEALDELKTFLKTNNQS